MAIACRTENPDRLVKNFAVTQSNRPLARAKAVARVERVKKHEELSNPPTFSCPANFIEFMACLQFEIAAVR
jgi:hypothetical protein